MMKFFMRDIFFIIYYLSARDKFFLRMEINTKKFRQLWWKCKTVSNAASLNWKMKPNANDVIVVGCEHC